MVETIGLLYQLWILENQVFLKIKDQPKIPHYSTVTNLSERVKLDLPEQILEFTISVSSNQLNQYNYTKQKRILTEPVISSMKLISI